MLLDADDQGAYLDIGVLQASGEQIYLSPGTLVTVGFGVPDKGYYTFDTTVIEQVLLPAPAVRLAYPQQIRRIQQRQHYRFSLQLPISFRVVNDLESHRSFITCTGYTLNISGGGLQLVTREPLVYGDWLEIDICSSSLQQIGLMARVLRVSDNLDNTCQASVQFHDIKRQDEEAIIRFIYQEQARRRRLEM